MNFTKKKVSLAFAKSFGVCDYANAALMSKCFKMGEPPYYEAWQEALHIWHDGTTETLDAIQKAFATIFGTAEAQLIRDDWEATEV